MDFREREETREVVDTLSKEFGRLLKIRNNIVHGKWFIDRGGDGGSTGVSIMGYKGRPSKTEGMKYVFSAESAQELIKHVDRAKCVRMLAERALVYTVIPTP